MGREIAAQNASVVNEQLYRRVNAAIAVVALSLRLAWVSWATRAPSSIFYDPSRYLSYGNEIASGNGMVEWLTRAPTAYYPPGYPWFVGIVTWLSSPFTDQPWNAVGVVQALLGTASALMVGWIARRIAGPIAGLVAAGVYAIYPNLIFHTGVVLSETLYIFLFLAFLMVLLSRPWNSEFSLQRALGAGVLLGLAVMVRPISLAVVPVVALCWMMARKDFKVVARWSAALMVGVMACIVPWTVRNAIRLDGFVLISTNTGDNLCMGHADGATGSFAILEKCEVPYEFLDGVEAELRGDREKQRIAIRSTLESLPREPWLLWRRTYFTWVRDGDHDGLFAAQTYRHDRWMAIPTEARLIWIADRMYWLVVVLGLVGCLQLIRYRRPDGVLLVGSALMTAAVPLAFFGDQRFKVPVIPLLIIVGATLLKSREEPVEPSGDPPASSP